MEQWAEIRRMHFVEGVAIKEIARRTGRDRKTVRKAIRRARPPGYSRPPVTSKLDPHREQIAQLLREVRGITNTRIRELIAESGYCGSKTILDDYLRELRPVVCPKRTYQRTAYRPGELLQFDLFEPRDEVPVGHGQTRRGYLVTCELGFSRAAAGALVFSKRFDDLAFGMNRCLPSSGPCPRPWCGTARARFTRAAVIRPRSSPPSADSWRSAGASWNPKTQSPRGHSSARTASCAPTSSRRGAL